MKRALAAVALAATVLTTGCARNRAQGDTSYVARDVETIYSLAKERQDRGAHRQAAVLFDEVERQHPYSVWARRAILMSAFNYYASRQYAEAVLAGQRFLTLHPGNRDAPYAYYIIAVSHYEQITDVSRDQQTSQRALDSLNELIRRYPDSPYAADARLKVDLVQDHLAGKEMEVGRFYARNRQWIAAAERFKRVVDRYQTTSHTPEALQRLVEAYLALGIPEEARKSAAVLGANYPGSVWYQRAYDLVREHGAA